MMFLQYIPPKSNNHVFIICLEISLCYKNQLSLCHCRNFISVVYSRMQFVLRLPAKKGFENICMNFCVIK